MTRQLPPAARQAVEGVCRALGLVAPVVTALPGGQANHTLRLRDARQDLVLRIAGAATALGANGESECRMQELAAAAGLAPAVVLSRPGAGLLVTRHVAGRMLSRDELHDVAQLVRIGRWIAALHALPAPPDLPYVDFGARAAGHLETLQARAPSPEAGELARRLQTRRAALAATPPAACHHDLHHRNIIDAGESLLVVDWEYAGPGDRAADLAACIRYHDLGPRETEALFAGYGPPDVALRARVSSLCWIFDCLWFGWNAVGALEGLAPEPALQQHLLARLLV
jgi:aminoglycoside phosphotransferase (APT) family kinase protein